MLKRFIWLMLAAAAGWLVWSRLRQRQDEYTRTTPQFAPPHTFAPPPEPQRAERPPVDQPATDVPPPATREPAATQEPAPAAPAAPADAEPPVAALAVEASPTAGDETIADVVGYCMRCKTKRPIQNAHHETTESGRPAARGTCPVCGAKMFTFLKDDAD
jgi:hypothetical protein